MLCEKPHLLSPSPKGEGATAKIAAKPLAQARFNLRDTLSGPAKPKAWGEGRGEAMAEKRSNPSSAVTGNNVQNNCLFS
jgi:hypothetical protein